MSQRPGFSIVEVIVALVLLAVAIVGLQTATAAFVQRASGGERAAGAGQLAEDRIQLIETDPEYTSLESRYEGVETDLPGWNGFARETEVLQSRDSTEAGIIDFTRVTVTVTGPGLPRPIARTTSIAQP